MRRVVALALGCALVLGSPHANATNFSVKTYGAVGDALTIFEGTLVIGTKDVTSASGGGPWVVGDVGKVIWCTSPGVSASLTGLTTIASFIGAGHITITVNAAYSVTATAQCTWGTQDETASFNAAATAATTGVTLFPGYTNPGTVTIPCGGYIVTAIIYSVVTAAPPSIVGDGKECVDIFISPTVTIPGGVSPVLMNISGFGWKLSGFTIYGPGIPLPMNAGQSLIGMSGTSPQIDDLNVIAVQSVANGWALNFSAIASMSVRNLYVQNSGANTAGLLEAAKFARCSGVVEDVIFSNFWRNLNITSISSVNARDGNAGQLVFAGGIVDECSAPDACAVLSSHGQLTAMGTTFWSGGQAAISVDATSALWLVSSNVGPFNYQAGTALTMTAGSKVFASSTTFRALGNVSVTNSGTFHLGSGNDFLKCPPSTCVPVPWRAAFTSPSTIWRD